MRITCRCMSGGGGGGGSSRRIVKILQINHNTCNGSYAGQGEPGRLTDKLPLPYET